MSFQPGRQLQPFQAQLVPALEHIHTDASMSSGSQESVLFLQRIKGGNGGMDPLQSHPSTTADSHTDIIHRGTDI
ncbi:hypothetical protein ARTHRO8AJ_50132 [Arthrobacter sp. 8AJ]|nr:hypothetical protein ARTHRO8AJ_50132 [Arthrobacter sp. 8AJ]